MFLSKVVHGVITDVELSGTSEAARDAFSRAIRLLSECTAGGAGEGGGGGTVGAAASAAAAAAVAASAAAGAEAKAGAVATVTDATQATSQARVLPGGDGGRNGDATLRVEEQARIEGRVISASDGNGPSDGANTATEISPMAHLEEVAASSWPLPPRPVSSNGALEGERGGVAASTLSSAAAGADQERLSPSRAPDGTVSSSAIGGGTTPLSLPSPKDEAVTALMNVMHGLELRFVARSPQLPLSSPKSSSLAPATESLASAVAAVAGGQGRTVEHIDTETDTTASGVGVAKTDGSKPPTLRRGGGWSVLVRPARVEELLADLLEKEKSSFAQTNRDGGKALERWSTAHIGNVSGNGSGNLSLNAPPFFLAPAMAVSAAPVAGTAAAAAAAVPPAVAAASGGGTQEVAGVSASAGSSSSTPTVTRAEAGAGSELSPRKRWHFPLGLSSTGLGENTSVFSMMLRGASLLGRHETAVLLAVRCTEHFLDACEVLTSPKGPLSVGGGARSLGKGARKGNGNEGLGAVHLLLTSRQEGGDRRVVDTSVSSACAEFLAHALAVVVWAIPHAKRGELFGGGCGGGSGGGGGGGGGGGSKSDGVWGATSIRAAARKTSVLRCLARLMRRSMDSDNTRVSC